MKLYLTVVDHLQRRRDVLVTAPAATPTGALLEVLDPGRPPALWCVGDEAVDPAAPLGQALHDGEVLTESSAAQTSHVARRTAPGAGPGPRDADQIELRIQSGPEAGRRWRLPPGTHLIGRTGEAAVKLIEDPEVSRRHAWLTVGAAGVSIADQGSTNGVEVDGVLIDQGPVPPGALIRVGETVLSWTPPDSQRAIVTPDSEGVLLYNRPPRIATTPPAATVAFPPGPPVNQGSPFPLMAVLAPAAIGLVMAFVLREVAFLLFIVLSPVIAVSNHLSQRRSKKVSFRARMATYERQLDRARAQIAEAVAAETAQRRQACPDPGEVAVITTTPTGRLWERRREDPDFLVLRLGVCDQPATIQIQGSDPAAGPDGAPGPLLPQVPGVARLAQDGVIGLAGPRSRCTALARWLVVQAAALHSPEDLAVTVLTDPTHPGEHQAWQWARWLPHCRDGEGRSAPRIGGTDASVSRLAGELSALVDSRLQGRAGPGSPSAASARAHLVVVDGAHRLGAIPSVTRVLRSGPEAGVYAICLDASQPLLPEECKATAVFDEAPATSLRARSRTGPPLDNLQADLVEAGWAEDLARALAPLRLNRRAGEATALPTSLRLLDQLGLEPPGPDEIARRWSGGGRSTAAVLGATSAGPLIIDLARDGPHSLVAGTTGSGKSELLQSLIASLSVANRPDAMNFVLVDYKGGSAFKDCSRLPHTVGMVTDLDSHLTERALASLSAELHRRERLLAGVPAKDIEDYWRLAGDGRERLARLVLVIDEFAALVEELPAFVDGLVDLARRGRSLGIHLILATQRPSGVVSAAIKTNTNLRIAMRVTDAADSIDVIDSPLAARIAKGLPGRGYLRVGHDELSEFQAGRIGGRRPAGGAGRLSVQPLPWEALGLPLDAGTDEELAEDATDLSELVAALRDASAGLGLPAPRSPWLGPLPDRIVLNPAALTGPPPGHPGVPALTAPFGMEDHPDSQARSPAVFDLERDGHLLVVGDPGSGRSTFLRTLAGSLGGRCSAADVHLFGIDCGNGALLPLTGLPQCGAIVSRSETTRVDRLVMKLLGEITRRQHVLARGGFATIADQRAAEPGARLPHIVVLLDRWEGYNAEFELLDGGRLVAAFLHLMREGLGVGVHAVVTGDRSATSARFASLVERIIMLRLNDRATYAAMGLNPRHLPDVIGVGRGFTARSGTELQIALLAEEPTGPAQVAALGRIAAGARTRQEGLPDHVRPEPVAALPSHLPLSGMKLAGLGCATSLVGVGGDQLSSMTVDLRTSGPAFVIAGPPRSGRSNALMVMARSLLAQGATLLAITPRASLLRTLAGHPGVAAVIDGRSMPKGEAEALLADLGTAPLTVIVDDAELISDAPIGELLTAYIRMGRDRDHTLVLAGTTSELGAFRGFIPEARKSHSGLLLCPGSPADGDLLGARLPRTALFPGPPGRGLLVTGGDLTLVQVPYDDTTAGDPVLPLPSRPGLTTPP